MGSSGVSLAVSTSPAGKMVTAGVKVVVMEAVGKE